VGAGPEEFTSLVERYARVMSAAIRRVCARQRSLIPDVEQEVRLALWKRLQGGKPIEHPVSYLHKLALTTAWTVLRRHRSEENLVEEERREVEPDGTGRELLPAERAALVEQTLARLPAESSRALRAYLAGFNHREVAVLYGWSESVARHRIYRAMELLRAAEKRGARDDG
jgi:RNA polymerase sigma factor (sigma-70 family)